MYEHILLPTDESPAAAAAIDHAISLAETYDATVHALYVQEKGGENLSPTDVKAAEYENVDARAYDAIERVETAGAERDVPVETIIESGSAPDVILDYAARTDADMIVMGTHAKSTISRVLLGSVAEEVVQESDVPVLTVRARED